MYLVLPIIRERENRVSSLLSYGEGSSLLRAKDRPRRLISNRPAHAQPLLSSSSPEGYELTRSLTYYLRCPTRSFCLIGRHFFADFLGGERAPFFHELVPLVVLNASLEEHTIDTLKTASWAPSYEIVHSTTWVSMFAQYTGPVWPPMTRNERRPKT